MGSSDNWTSISIPNYYGVQTIQTDNSIEPATAEEKTAPVCTKEEWEKFCEEEGLIDADSREYNNEYSLTAW